LHGARNTVQQLLHKTLNFISPELWPQQAKAYYNICGVYSRMNMLQFNKIEEIKQRLVELWKSSTAFE